MNWLDAETQLTTIPRTSTTAFSLTVREGATVGATITIDERSPEVSIGTSEANNLVIPDSEVSRRHVRMEVREGLLRVRDAGSTNGTWVNGTRTVEALLSGGETVRIGATVLAVIRSTRDVEVSTQTSFGDFVGASVAVRRLYPLCARLAFR